MIFIEVLSHDNSHNDTAILTLSASKSRYRLRDLYDFDLITSSMSEDNQPEYREDNHYHHHHDPYHHHDAHHHNHDSDIVVEVSNNKKDDNAVVVVDDFPILLDDYDVIGRYDNISYIDNGEVINDDNTTAKHQSINNNNNNRNSDDVDDDYLEMFSIPNYVYTRNHKVGDDDSIDYDDDVDDKNIKIKNKNKKKKKKIHNNNNNKNHDDKKNDDIINVDVETKLFNDLNVFLRFVWL